MTNIANLSQVMQRIGSLVRPLAGLQTALQKDDSR